MSGLRGLTEYLSAHVLMCLVPAFFLAGAIAALIPKEYIVKYFGPNTPKRISYSVAALSGLLIAVCSCTILPLFAGIWKRGAGLGPAVTFLFAGPAINLLAIVYTGQLIGMDFAVARAVLAILFAILIGLIMARIFGEKEDSDINKNYYGKEKGKNSYALEVEFPDSDKVFKSKHYRNRVLILFGMLIGILVVGTAPVDLLIKSVVLIGLVIALGILVRILFTTDETKSWLSETYFFVKMIFPLLIVGVFIAGMVSILIPPEIVGTHLGSNTIQANSFGVGFGIFMYFPTLVEVPIASMFLGLGMHKGPLLAYLLSDPELSLQSILVTRKIMGNKRNLAYVGLVAIFCIIAGLIFGLFVDLWSL
jgi:uncharacterized membrane protein YraQ (UPF0718 family)